MKQGKIVIIGAGHVGSHCASALMQQGVCSKIILIDKDTEKAKSQALDLQDANSFQPRPTEVSAGDYEDCKDADLLVLAAGVPRLSGQTRMDVLKDTEKEICEIAPRVKKSGFSGITITISNPADVIAFYFRRLTGFPAERVFSTGTGLDTARLRRALAKALKVDPRSISCFAMGEHGDSQSAPLSLVRVGGESLSDFIKNSPALLRAADLEGAVHDAAFSGTDIIEGKGSTEFGIGAVLADTAKAVLFDEHRMLPVSVLLRGQYGQSDVYAGVPAMVGANGIEYIPDLPLLPEEEKAFGKSCDAIRRAIATLS